MTEKEFDNLKVGDKVWIITDWFNKSNEGMKAFQIEVSAKDNEAETIKFVGGAFNRDFCFLTKAEAWEKEIKRFEEALKSQEQEVEKDRKALYRYKVELAKAKEEEEVVWTVDFDEGKVVRSTKRRWEGSVENYEWSLGSPRYKPCETEQEAYEALANYYKGKYEEALSKACVVRYFVCGKRIITLHDCYEFLGGNFYGYDYDGQKHCSVHRGEDIFPTRQEAEAELERRKAK